MTSNLLTTTEVAAILRTPPGSLRWWRHVGTGPRSFKIGRRVVYRDDDLAAWVAEQERTTESSP